VAEPDIDISGVTAARAIISGILVVMTADARASVSCG
jgi:hypothetical protein